MRPAALHCLLVFAIGAAGCGEWSGAPVKTAEPGAVPLGPGPTLAVARTGGEPGPPAIDSWGATVAIAWAEPVEGGARAAIKASTSQDAGATFAAPIVVGDLPLPGDPGLASMHTQVGVAAPVPGGRAGAPQVWVRSGLDSGSRTLTWHSRDGGRSFAELAPHEAPPDTVFPERWVHVDGEAPATPQTLRVIAGGARRSAGIQEVPLPPGAQGDPAVVVDEHGALALAWRERDTAGARTLVVRRAWVDWNANGGNAPGFDAAYTLATLGDEASAPSIARVPGGVIVSWVDPGPDGAPAVFARRLGMDMTCTLESTATTSK